MKKQLYLLGSAVTLGVGALTCTNVFADSQTVNTAEELKNCITQVGTATCTLGDNIENWSELVNITGNITLNLNDKNITSNSIAKFFQVKSASLNIVGNGEISTTDSTNTGVIRVYGSDATGGTPTKVSVGEGVTINGVNPIVIYNNNATAYNTTVDVYGNLNGVLSGVWVIGTISNTENYPVVNIHDGAVLNATDKEGIGLSAMGYAEYNIGAAEITGVGSGIGTKAGIINIDGATVTGTGSPEDLPPEPYGNGMNPSGAAIQFEGHPGYAGAIELNIESGTFVSENKYAVYGNKEASVDDADVVKSIKVTEATFSSALGVINQRYLALPDIEIANGSTIDIAQDGTSCTIKKVAEVDGLKDGEKLIIEEVDELSEEMLADLEKKATEKSIENLNIDMIYDLGVLGSDGSMIENHEGEVNFTMPIKGEVEPAEGYTRDWYLFYFHKNELKEIKDFTVENGKLTFSTDEFSTYILAYEDKPVVTENPEVDVSAKSPETGTFTKNDGYAAESGILAGAIAGIATVLGATAIAIRRVIKK